MPLDLLTNKRVWRVLDNFDYLTEELWGTYGTIGGNKTPGLGGIFREALKVSMEIRPGHFHGVLKTPRVQKVW